MCVCGCAGFSELRNILNLSCDENKGERGVEWLSVFKEFFF